MTYQLSKKDFYAEPLSKTKAIPEEFVKEAYLVFACRHKFCRDICPNFDITRNEAHTSYGFHTSILAISRGVGEFDKLMDNFTYCLECGACELRCPNTSMGGDFYRRSTTTVDLVRKVRRDHMADGGEITNWAAVKEYLDEHRGFVASAGRAGHQVGRGHQGRRRHEDGAVRRLLHGHAGHRGAAPGRPDPRASWA